MDRIARMIFILGITAALAACTGDYPGAGGDGSGTGSGGSAVDGGDSVSGLGAGPGISVDEALEADTDEQLLVNGYLVATDDEVRLCTALAESYPPQCGGSSLVVQGVNLDEIDGLTTAQGVSWTDEQTQLLGTVRDGVLSFSPDVQG